MGENTQETITFQILDWNQYNKFKMHDFFKKKNAETDNLFESVEDSDDMDSDDDSGPIDLDQLMNTNIKKNVDNADDMDNDSEDEYDDPHNLKGTKYLSKYKMRLFGKTIDNKSIYVHINNFNPYFYVRIPNSINEKNLKELINQIRNNLLEYLIPRGKNADETIRYEKVQKSTIKGLIDFEIVKSKDLFYFTRYSEFKFLKLIFINIKSFKTYEYYLLNEKISNYKLFKKDKPIKLQIYESNIEPFIRFMHIKNLNACGWCRTNKYKILHNVSHCDISIDIDWNNIESIESNAMQKFIIVSFDIECMSADGDFPQSSRDPIIQIGSSFSYY